MPAFHVIPQRAEDVSFVTYTGFSRPLYCTYGARRTMDVRQALETGVNGYVREQLASVKLYAAIAAVDTDMPYTSPVLVESLPQ